MADREPMELTDANFQREVLESEQPVLVDLWAPWCGPCRMLSPIIEELAATHAGTVKVGKLNVDDSPETAGKYGVSSIPTVLVFNGGELVERFVGLQPKERYERAVEQLSAARDQE
jgi:thioredoxin 1